MSKMKLSEAAAYLGKSADQVRRYANSEQLSATRIGKELLFEREDVNKFAEERGMRVAESGVPQGSNFTDPFSALERVANLLPQGVTLNIRNPQEPAVAKVSP